MAVLGAVPITNPDCVVHSASTHTRGSLILSYFDALKPTACRSWEPQNSYRDAETHTGVDDPVCVFSKMNGRLANSHDNMEQPAASGANAEPLTVTNYRTGKSRNIPLNFTATFPRPQENTGSSRTTRGVP